MNNQIGLYSINNTNISYNYTWENLIRPSIFAFLYGLTFIFGIVFNMIIIVIYTKKQGLKHFTKYFFISLSVSDMMVLSICIPRALCDIFTDGEWRFGYFYCKVYYLIENGLTFISSFTIIAISLERYFAVCRPLKAKSLLNKKIFLNCLILIWILGLVISMPFLWITDYVKDADECDLNLSLVYLIYIISINVLFVLLPMLLLTYIYINIIVKSKKTYDSFSEMFSMTRNSLRKSTTDQTKLSLDSFHEKKYRIQKFNSIHEIELISVPRLNIVNSLNKNFLHENYRCESIKKANDIYCKRICKSSNDLFNAYRNRASKSYKLSSSSSLASMDLLLKLKAKRKYKSTVLICFLTILCFWCQMPIRLFICWSYVNSYSSKFGADFYGNFVETNFSSLSISNNFFIFIYFLNIVLNSVIYNIFSAQFRKALKFI